MERTTATALLNGYVALSAEMPDAVQMAIEWLKREIDDLYQDDQGLLGELDAYLEHCAHEDGVVAMVSLLLPQCQSVTRFTHVTESLHGGVA